MPPRKSNGRSENRQLRFSLNRESGNSLIPLSLVLLPKVAWVRLLKMPVEGRLAHGFEGIDVGDRIRVELMSVDVDRGYIDFRKVGPSRH